MSMTVNEFRTVMKFATDVVRLITAVWIMWRWTMKRPLSNTELMFAVFVAL